MNSREVARKIIDDLVADLLQTKLIHIDDLPHTLILKWINDTQDWVEKYKP